MAATTSRAAGPTEPSRTSTRSRDGSNSSSNSGFGGSSGGGSSSSSSSLTGNDTKVSCFLGAMLYRVQPFFPCQRYTDGAPLPPVDPPQLTPRRLRQDQPRLHEPDFTDDEVPFPEAPPLGDGAPPPPLEEVFG